jgi:hypothetical protein
MLFILRTKIEIISEENFVFSKMFEKKFNNKKINKSDEKDFD